MINIIPTIKLLNRNSYELSWFDSKIEIESKNNIRIFNWSIVRLNRTNKIKKLFIKYESDCNK